MKEINRNDELSSNEKGLGLKCEIPIDENKRKLKDAQIEIIIKNIK